MTHKPETRIVASILTALHTHVGGYWVKIHGSPFQRVGLPDIIGCVEGLFIALEVKQPGGDYEPIQRKEAQDIQVKGKGVAACVHSPSEALDVVRTALRRTKARG
jgi:hypothetical protein